MNNLVILVDDDPIVNFLHKRMMAKYCPAAYKRVVEDGRQALELLQAKNEDYENILVLLDINMPVMNGWEFLDEVSQSEIGKKITVFILSSSVAEEDVKKSEGYDLVEGYLIKPLTQKKCEWLRDHPKMQKFFETDEV